MALTAAQMVTLIDEAIESILGGKNASVNVNGRSFTRHNLKDLRDLRAFYKREEQLTASTGPRGLRISPIHHGGTVTTEGQD